MTNKASTSLIWTHQTVLSFQCFGKKHVANYLFTEECIKRSTAQSFFFVIDQPLRSLLSSEGCVQAVVMARRTQKCRLTKKKDLFLNDKTENWLNWQTEGQNAQHGMMEIMTQTKDRA